MPTFRLRQLAINSFVIYQFYVKYKLFFPLWLCFNKKISYRESRPILMNLLILICSQQDEHCIQLFSLHTVYICPRFLNILKRRAATSEQISCLCPTPHNLLSEQAPVIMGTCNKMLQHEIIPVHQATAFHSCPADFLYSPHLPQSLPF